jgi:hypothetical protein
VASLCVSVLHAPPARAPNAALVAPRLSAGLAWLTPTACCCVSVHLNPSTCLIRSLGINSRTRRTSAALQTARAAFPQAASQLRCALPLDRTAACSAHMPASGGCREFFSHA